MARGVAPGWREVVAVLAGGMLGTGLRLLADTLLPHDTSAFPISTLVVNVVGAFVLGTLVSSVWTRPRTPNWAKAGLGAGLLGSFTTFSALVTSLLVEATHGMWWLAVVYLLASLLLGFAAAALGLRVGHRPPPRPDLVDE
ncbi:fluoride efflux transporter FluC [Parafrigoribacterium soli]|uniref:fluoride efflux transporter FluC n=1 Tax=Parafrigoribacterium soli TaxID=3144663 RepID=UPI0032EB3A43